jgi:hypothetical protein
LTEQTAQNPKITRLLWTLTAVEALVVAMAGGALYFLPDLARALWPWELTPFNTAALGAVYLGALVAIVSMVAAGRWAPARVVLPAVGAFTAIVLVVSLFYLDRFDFTRWGTWLWFLLYVILPVNAAYHLWLYRRQPPALALPVALWWRPVLLGLTVAAGLYALGLLLIPEVTTGYWPWRVDAFHGRLYSAAFVSVAIMAYLTASRAAKVELLTVGLSVAVSGGLTLLSLVLVDASRHVVDWSAAGTWLWIATFAVLVGVGIGTAWLGLRPATRAAPAVVVGS